MSPTSLQRKISKAMVDSAFDHRKSFFPISSFSELITSKQIDPTFRDYPRMALIDAPKVIAILLYMEKFDCLEPLYSAGLRDEHLPLDLIEDGNSDDDTSDDESGDTVVNLQSVSGDRTFAAPSLDGPRFVRDQWFFLSPSFGGPDLDEINVSCILPITFKATERMTGSYSSVFKVKIHPAHLVGNAPTTATDTGPTFALKQLISDSEVEFRQEEEALRRIHRLEHEHLIRVVSSFRRGHDYFFLFPWAEKGNLWQVWERRSNEKREIDLIKWVLEQIKGIASGVRILHFLPDNPVSEENCRHGDLRPENILLFPSSSNDQFGTLRITDVGLAKIHELRTENRVRGTTTRGGDQQYAPPKTGDKRSRKYDIWSLGCIYLEFVVWVLGGMDEVHRFEKARGTAHLEYYSTKSSKGAEILPAVTRWIKDIRNDARCEGKNAFRDLIELVEGHLLVIDEEKRYDANELDAALAQILDDVHKSDGYLLNKSSRGGFVPSEIQHHSRFRKLFK